MLEFYLSQNLMAGTKLSHPNGRIQFCPMEDTFVHSIATLCSATDFLHTTYNHCQHALMFKCDLHFTFNHHGFSIVTPDFILKQSLLMVGFDHHRIQKVLRSNNVIPFLSFLGLIQLCTQPFGTICMMKRMHKRTLTRQLQR